MRKILSLILTICMLMTMVVATYTDAPAIEHKEAVDVLSAIQVVNGYTDGSFKPEGNVTRAEMAKMICVLLNKGEDVGNLYSGAVTFSDCVNHWAAGYIAYCAQEKIINGRNAYTFDPDANVTGTEAAKMLLCALGYDPNVEGLVGANWAANTLSLAKKLELKAKNAGGSVNEDVNFSLLDNLDNISMVLPLLRGDAAQMIFNALQCTLVDYDGTAQTISIGNTSFTTGAKLLSRETSLYNEYHALTAGKRLTKAVTNGDDFGRPATIWTRGGEEIGSYTKNPTATYKDAVSGGRVYTDLGKPQFGAAYDGKYTLKVFVDGVDAGDGLKTKIVSGNTDDVTPAGSWTEVYVDDDNMTITMVTAKYYVAQIAGVYDARRDYNGDITREAYVTLKKIDGNAVPYGDVELADGTHVAGAFVTNEFTTYDRNITNVVYTKANNKIQSLTKAVVKSGLAGSMTKTIDGRLTGFYLDSISYNVAASATAFGADYGTSATIYLDPNGNIVYAEATASSAVAFVLNAGQEVSNLYGDVTTGANLLFTDGSCKKVNVYNANGAKYTIGEAQALAGTVVSYYVNINGEYVLTPIGYAIAGYGYNNNIARVMNNNPNLEGSNMYANDSTVFIVETSSQDSLGTVNYTYSTYTGLKNVPTVEEKDPNAVALRIAAVNSRSNTAVASYVFVVGGKTKDATRASVSVFMKNPATDRLYTDSNNSQFYTTTAIIDGQITTAKMTEGTYTALNYGTLNAYTNMSVDGNGYITGLTKAYDMNTYVKNFVGFNGEDGLYNAGIITLRRADTTTESFGVKATTPVYVFDTIANTVVPTTLDMFNTTMNYKDLIVVFDSTEKILNNVEVVTAIYVVLN